jgi:hypothetical protein
LDWVHISFKTIGNRNQALEASFLNGNVHYEEWRMT